MSSEVHDLFNPEFLKLQIKECHQKQNWFGAIAYIELLLKLENKTSHPDSQTLYEKKSFYLKQLQVNEEEYFYVLGLNIYNSYQNRQWSALIPQAFYFLSQRHDSLIYKYLLIALENEQAYHSHQLIIEYCQLIFSEDSWFKLSRLKENTSNISKENILYHQLDSLFSPAKAVLSVCLIVKNEAHVILDCLESVDEIADEIIIGDTGSDDDTIKLCHQFSEKVQIFSIPWNDHFSQARNQVLDRAKGQWILSIDADETLDSKSLVFLKEFFRYSPIGKQAYCINWCNQYNDTRKNTIEPVIRIFPNDKRIRFHGMIHNRLYCKDDRFGLYSLKLPVQIKHIGYGNKEIEKKQKSLRLPLIEKSLNHPDYNSPYIHYHYAYSLIFQHSDSDLNHALQELKYCFKETLKYKDNPPSPTWFPAPLGKVCVLVFRLLFMKDQYEEILSKYDSYKIHCNIDEFYFLTCLAFIKLKKFEQAKVLLERLVSEPFEVIKNEAGYSDWKARLLLDKLKTYQNLK